MDTGSNKDVIDEELVSELELLAHYEMMEVSVLGKDSIGPRQVASFSINSLDGNYEAEIRGAMVAKLRVTSQSDIPPAKRNFSDFSHLRNLPFIDIDDGIGMIIGIAHWEAWTDVESSKGPVGAPMGLRTAFGWTVQGGNSSSRPSTMFCNVTSSNDAVLKESLERIFFNDFSLVSEAELGQSKENAEAIRQLQESISFDEQRGKYVVGLPWRYGREKSAEILNAVNSRAMAERRLRSMIPKLKKNAERRQRVFAEVDKFEPGLAKKPLF